MIDQIVDLTKKSFNGYTGPVEKFKPKNVIFGYNGRGKSSLALGVKEFYLEDTSNSEEKMRFFSQEEDNLSLQDPVTGKRSKIKGVIANFGTKDVESEDKIKKLKAQEIDLEPINTKITELKFDARTAIDAIHDRRKGTVNIQKKTSDFEISKVIDLYTQDLAEAKKIEADESKLVKIEGDNVIGEKIELIRTIMFQSFDKISAEEITEASEIFNTDLGDVDIPSSEIVEWIDKGVDIHEAGDDCQFCGNSINLHNIKERVREYNENKKQKAIKSLQVINYKMAELQTAVQDCLDRKSNVESSLEADEAVTASYDAVREASIGITRARNAIKEKIKNIDSVQTFVDFSGDLLKFNDAIETLYAVRNDQLKNLETQNNNKNTLVKGAIGLEIVKDKTIQGKIKDIETESQALDVATNTNKEIRSKIQSLKQAKSVTADFAVYISGILASLNINLKLVVSEDDKNYVIQHTHSNVKLVLSDISEGERNLLALLFFYYALFRDNEQQDFKDEIELIIVDDPVSSMDDINRMYILELMKQVLILETPQVFILTHSWEDFSNICYGFTDKSATPSQPATKYGFYEIKKDATGSSLVQKTKSNVPPYHHNFAEVYEFSQRPDITSLDDCDIYHMPNIMRQVLEGFLGFKTRKTSPTSNNMIEIGQVLYHKDWSKVTESEKMELGKLLLVANVNSHSSSRSPDEIWQSANFLMKRIANVDKRHFDTNRTQVVV